MTEWESGDEPFDSNEAAAIYSIHRAIAQWQKHRGCIARVMVPAEGVLSGALLLRSANEALSSYVIRAEVRELQDGRAVVRIIIKNLQGLSKT
jgi:hypothetical protein